jgi:hypothetical protein
MLEEVASRFLLSYTVLMNTLPFSGALYAELATMLWNLAAPMNLDGSLVGEAPKELGALLGAKAVGLIFALGRASSSSELPP